jgi:hypothetical protein
MHPQPEGLRITLCKLTIRCRRHGKHVLVMASLDNTAEGASEYLQRAYGKAGVVCESDCTRIDYDLVKRMIDGEEFDLDDLPY